MALLNYTTTVAVSRTAGQVHDMLAKAGARRIMTEYDDDGDPVGVAFTIDTPAGLRSFLLPVKVDAVERVLVSDRSVPPRYSTRAHAAGSGGGS